MKGLDVMLLGQRLFEHIDGRMSICDQDRSNEFWEEIPKDLVIFGYDAHSPEEIINGWNYYKDLTSHDHFVGRS